MKKVLIHGASNTEFTVFRFENVKQTLVVNGTLYLIEKDGTKHTFSPAWNWRIVESKP